MSLSTCTVLIVEDFLPDQELYRRCLCSDAGHSYRFLQAETTTLALQLCQTQSIDAILLDYRLPDGDGLSFLEALQAQGDDFLPAVVMVTGEGDEQTAVRALKLGAEDYLVKDQLTPELLRCTVRTAIENARLRLQLQQSEARFRTSIENMLDCFGIYSAMRDANGQIVDFRIDYLNAAALACNCMASADIGQGLCELLPAHRQSGLFAEYCRVVETGEPLVKTAWTYDDWFGTQHLRRAFDIHVSKLDDGFVASWRDVTERRQLELDLAESERRFREIFNTVYQFIGLLSPAGILLEANQAALDFAGLTRAAVIGRPFWEARWWTISAATQRQLQEAIARAAGGEFVRYEVEIRGQGDHTAVLDFSLKPVRDEAGRVVLLIPEGRDISDRLRHERDRKRLQDALQENEERLRLAIQGAGMATWDMDLQTGRAIWSEGHFQILGYVPHPDGEATAEMWRRCVHPDDLAGVLQAVEQARQRRSLCISEHRVLRVDNGETRWIQAFGRFLDNEAGQASRFIGIFFDATPFKQTERALAKSNERFERAAAAVNCLIYDYDLQQNTIERSQGLTNLFGYATDEVEPTVEWWFERIHPDHRERLRADKCAALASGDTAYCFEYRVQHRQGYYVWVQDQGLIVRDADGQALRVVGSTVDISDRKQSEAALRQSEEHYRSLAGLIPQLVWIATPEGELLEVNDRWFEFTGQTLEQAGWQSVVHPQDVPILAAAWSAAQQEGSRYQAEGRMRRFDGVYRWHLHQALPLRNDQGQVVQWFGTATDIHDLKQIEADRARLLAESEAARAEAEAANRSKDEFVSMVAHELRSPLNAIAGWANLLRTRQLDAETTQTALETIARNTQAQVQLVEDLLDVSRMARGSLPLEFAPVDLREVVMAAVETVRPVAQAKSLCLNVQLQPVAPLQGDGHRLQQVVLNLLTNAIKFTPGGGQISLMLSVLPPLAAADLPWAQLQVSDTGKGIAPDLLPRIFERFQQDRQNDTAKQGLGLGLAIAQYIVQQHGGTITAYSPGSGQGATFTVQFPLGRLDAGIQDECRNDQSSPAPPPSPSPQIGVAQSWDEFLAECCAPQGSQPKIYFSNQQCPQILLVDDNADALSVTAFVLEEAGAVVRTAQGVAAALQELARERPDLVISDIAMPDQDGYELLRQMRALYPGAAIPAIALTACAAEISPEQWLQAGFQQHLTKPVESEVLLAAIARLLQEVPSRHV